MPRPVSLSRTAHSPRLRHVANAAIVTFTGAMDETSAHACGAIVDAALTSRPRLVVADLSRADVVAASVPLLTWMQHRVRAAGARFAVAGLSARARVLLAQAEGAPALALYPDIPTPPPWGSGGGAVLI